MPSERRRKKLIWMQHAGDFTANELRDVFYSPRTSKAHRIFIKEQEELGFIRLINPTNKKRTWTNPSMWTWNKNLLGLCGIPEVVTHGTRGHAMSPIAGRRTNYSEEDDDED